MRNQRWKAAAMALLLGSVTQFGACGALVEAALREVLAAQAEGTTLIDDLFNQLGDT